MEMPPKFLPVLLAWALTASLWAQSPDSTYYNRGNVLRVVADQDTTFYYRVSVHYPAAAREANLGGTMMVHYSLDSTCTVRNVVFENSLGEDFERSIRDALNDRAKMVRFYEPRKCATGPYHETVTFDLGL